MNPQKYRQSAYLSFICLRAEAEAAGARYMRTGHSYLSFAWLYGQMVRAWNVYLLSVSAESAAAGRQPNPAKDTYENRA